MHPINLGHFKNLGLSLIEIATHDTLKQLGKFLLVNSRLDFFKNLILLNYESPFLYRTFHPNRFHHLYNRETFHLNTIYLLSKKITMHEEYCSN